jgi:DNA-binding transcriptional MerR regulator
MGEPDKTEELANALGAARVVDVERRVGGPLDLLALREEIGTRLRSSGGRPTDPAWTVARQVPFKRESWDQLQELADQVGTSQRRVGAAQLAAILVEYGLEEVQTEQWTDIREASQAAPLLTASEAAEAAGISFRQLEAWRKYGYITPARVQGRRRWFSIDAVVRMIWLRSLSDLTREKPSLTEQMSRADLSARYLIVTNGETVRTTQASSEVLTVLTEPGFHHVIDQLQLRLRLLDGDRHNNEEGRREGGEAKAG